MRNGNWGYSADRSSPNWTGRIPRQSRITGYWSQSRQPDSIPLSGYIIGGLFLVLVVVATYL